MLSNKIYKTIKEGIQNGTYKRIRIVRILENSEREILITYNGYVRGGEESTVKRLDYIKNQIDRILPPGNYVIECATTPNGNSGIVDSFKIIKSPVTIPIVQAKENNNNENIEDHTTTQEPMAEFDLDEYKDLLRQISKLESIVEVQKLQIEHLKEQLAKAPLNDQGQGSGVMKMIEEHAPVALGILDKFLSQRDKAMDLKDRELALAENGHTSNGHGHKKKKFIRQVEQQKSKEEILQDMQDLSASDPAAFEATLDDMEKKNPALYDYICNEMDLFDDGSDEQEGGEE